MKTQHFIEIRFIEDFATKKAGDIIRMDGMQARSLINRGVAVFSSEPIKEETKVIHTKKSKKNEKDN